MSAETDSFSSSLPNPLFIELGSKLIDTTEQTVSNGQSKVKLEPLSFNFLMFLISNYGAIVSREVLLEKVWNNRVVTDDALRKVVRKLRLVLEDDAKNPRYIKTIPGQGYELIAVPRHVNKLPTNKLVNDRPKLIWLLFSIGLLVAVASYVFVLNKHGASTNAPAQVSMKMLTQLPNNEVSGSYNADTEQLLFIYQESTSSGWQIFSKDLTTQISKQLTNDSLSYKAAQFSPEGKRVAYTRFDGEKAQLLIADYDLDLGLSNEREVTSNPDATGLLSWSSNGRYLYTSTFGQDFSSGSRGVYRIDIKSGRTDAVTFPNLRGGGDFYALESPSGSYLAVLRMEADRRFRLMIIDLDGKKVHQESAVSFFPYRLIWQGEDALAVSGAKGEFYRYSVRDNDFEPLLEGRVDFSEVFYQCGPRCYFMTKHSQNYTNIREIDNPYFSKSTKPLMQIDTGGAEFHPTYSQDGSLFLYIVKDKSSSRLMLQGQNEQPIELYRAPANTVIKQLSFNPQMTKIVGKLETQIFVLDIETKAVKLITSPLALVNHPNWDLTGSIVYFSREQNNNTGLYQYKIQQDREHKLYDDIVSIRMFYPELTLAVDINRQVFQLYPDGSRRFIVQLQNVSSDHWEVVDEYLYFTQIDYDKVNLYRLNLVDLKLDSNSLDVSPAWSRFSMDRSSKRLLVTDTLSRQRDLVQVSW